MSGVRLSYVDMSNTTQYFILANAGVKTQSWSRAIELHRSPMSDAWFVSGDARVNPQPVEIEAFIDRGSTAATMLHAQNLSQWITQARKIEWQNLYRTILAGEVASITPRGLTGYQLTIRVYPDTPTWLVQVGGQLWQ